MKFYSYHYSENRKVTVKNSILYILPTRIEFLTIKYLTINNILNNKYSEVSSFIKEFY